ncbi:MULTISPECIES: GNAT family N-acetyltransferase [Klebsiella]|uniref:GNAT family N-acetyltransferase n=1 Tax=Klebsiella TaxID=570 RepID=UPI00029842B5|nr:MULTISPECIES: GNAT family N-acetyltransferase [Klebsiella]EKP29324.1 GNAT family acetyltransferase [Klebsiella michiganensis]ARI10276.1 GNAT family N-acetyltransferase [Klebsiella sp. M5al]KZT47446.1 GNAT family acetyltransferase [Klebsiella michiganensis]MBZ0040935.1 GNAT family N-acetyltransferase [Klebsiella grimontii]PLL60389.1 GNAT family N-acetyltransferase [Klebsiella michiganensis]
MIIQPLHAAPQHASRVTEWLWQVFGGETLPQAFFASIVGHSQTPGALPITFIAAEGEMLLGTVGLWRCDLISRQDLYPWMAALYVAPEARGRGLAGKLQQHVIGYARTQGYSELFLYSACRDFYERFGWQYIGEGLDYPAVAVSLYRYDLSLSRGAITE